MKPHIQAFVFDAYGTLFDVYSVFEELEKIFPKKGQQISETWRQKQIEYSFLREMMGRYRPFSGVTRDALRFACEQAGEELNNEIEDKLLQRYLELDIYPEVTEVLSQLSAKRKAIFSNGSPDMLNPLVVKYQLDEVLDSIITVDDKKRFKPVPASYTSVLENLSVKRDEVLFMSSNPWDIAGAKSFGFNTAWINRAGKVMDKLGLDPDYEYGSLEGILEHI
ncbi:haloacid dehalogenase type II [Bacillus tianshenii]|nr:haloacid dehalogenase type II [Bacillus tianshenii]